MPIKGYITSDLVSRITLTLPSKFNITDTNTNLYAFWSGICEALKINTDYIDELFRQTNIVTASGSYVDTYITELSAFGRLSSTATGSVAETDDQYKLRFNKMLFTYNCTQSGLKQIIIDLTAGGQPSKMYTGSKRGAYFNDKYHYNNSIGKSIYGNKGSTTAYTAYIEFSRKPNRFVFSQMCRQLASCKAYGIQIFLRYPQYNDLVVNFPDGTFERSVSV